MGIAPVVISTAKKAAPVAQQMSAFSDMISAWRDYQSVREQQITERARIASDRDVNLTAIHEQASLLRLALTETFRERREVFDKSFAQLNQGLKDGNPEQVNAALTLITAQIKESPVAQAAQLMQSIHDPRITHVQL